MTRIGCHVEAGAGRDCGDQAAALLSSAIPAVSALSPPLARSTSILASSARLRLELGVEREGLSDARAIGVEAFARVGEPVPVGLLLALEVGQRMFEAGDGAERRDRHGKLDLELRAGAHAAWSCSGSRPSEALAAKIEVETADRGDDDLASPAEAARGSGFPASARGRRACARQRPCPSRSWRRRRPAVGTKRSMSCPISPMRRVARSISRSASRICRRMACWSSIWAARRRSSRAISASSPAFCIRRGSPRRDRLGHRELVRLALAEVLEAADAGIAGERGGDEAGLALVVLPHRGVERAERRIGEDVDLVMLVALPHDPALALLDLRRQPRHVEMMQAPSAEAATLTPVPIVSDEPIRKRTLPALKSLNRRCFASDFLKSCMKAISDAGTPRRTSSFLIQR